MHLSRLLLTFIFTLALAANGTQNTLTDTCQSNSKPTHTDESSTSNEDTGRNAVTIHTDCRGVFQGLAYLGLVIDSFAAQDLRQYLNPEESGKVISERSIFGTYFSYRLGGNSAIKAPTSKSEPTDARRFQRVNQLWIYGNTLHGVRSADVNCTETPELPTCKSELGEFTGNIPEASLYMLRNATSLEGHVGIRYEFLGLQQHSDTPANLYVTAKLGFLNVAGVGGDLVNLSTIGLGAVATKGDFMNSHLELGVGRSDLYFRNPSRRFKVDGHLQRKLPSVLGKRGMSLFVRMLVDSDLGPGADSVQSYVGVLFDLGSMFKTPQ